MPKPPRILLSSVFGPFGVDDAYGRKENIMELFHNQVTREQGVFSLRYNHQSFGLYLIAENLEADTTVLDFPSEKRFVREIRKGYDFVGIAFIVPNFSKAKRMAELVRKHAPSSQIVLGGHGTAIPGIEHEIPCDHVCRGEGVRFMRALIGDDPNLPISHPVMPSSFNNHVLGIPRRTEDAVLMTGVGCPNACRFCCTSHFFKREYVPFLKTGRDIYDFCERAEREHGYKSFFIMDENFLKHRRRAEEFLELLERNGKYYVLSIFSSAEAVSEVGVDFMARLGIRFLWLGMEGRNSEYAKNDGIDLPALVSRLRENGIVVLGSIILFSERHTPENIQDDIDFVIDAGPDFIQFMQLGPLPGTALYEAYERAGRIRHDVPYEEWHGQHRIWFDHPHFTAEETESYLRDAFIQAWDRLGGSLLRVFETTLMGYHASRGSRDPMIEARHADLEQACLAYYPALPAIAAHAHNDLERDYARDLIGRYREAFGPMTGTQRVSSLVARAMAAVEAARIAAGLGLRQPRTHVTRFRSRGAARIRKPAQHESGLPPRAAGRSVQGIAAAVSVDPAG